MRLEPVSLKARKSFKGIKKGQSFQAIVLAAYINNLVEFAVLKFEDGAQHDVPYDHFVFEEIQEEGEGQ